MSLRRSLFIRIALVLLVALPLRAQAAIGGCGTMEPQETSMSAMDMDALERAAPLDGESMTDHAGRSDHAVPTAHVGLSGHAGHESGHATCSVCCCAAVIGSASFRWSSRSEPRIAPPAPAVATAPLVVLDGLERPPRPLST